MKLGKIIWPAVLICSIALGVWQMHNISVFWREYHYLWRDYDYKDGSLVPRKPFISEDAARTDPEAAAIADMMLHRYEKEGYLNARAENTLKFPNNEYLLFSNTGTIFGHVELDQEIAVKLAEKLINLEKNNSLYQYLKAAAMLANRQGNNITPALEEIKIATTSSNFYFPFSKYKRRIETVAERSSLLPTLIGEFSNWSLYAPGVENIPEVLLRYAHRAFVDGETEKGLLIDDAINSIGKNQFDAGYNEARYIIDRGYINQMFYFGYWLCPEMLELQRAKITEQRARQDRLQFCPYVLQRIKDKKTKGRADYSLYRKREITDEQMIFTVPVALFNGRMLFVTTEVWLALVVICIFRGWSSNQRIGFSNLLLFAGVSLCYFLLVNGRFFIPLKFLCNYYFLHPLMMRPEPIGLKYILDVPMRSFVFLICPVLAALLLWAANRPGLRRMSFWLKIPLKLILATIVTAIATTLLGILGHFAYESRHLPDFLKPVVFMFIFALLITMFTSKISKSRFAKGILAAMPLGVLTDMASPYAYISQIPMILFVIICTLIVLNKPSEPMPFVRALIGIFSKGAESAAIRSRAVKLLAIFLVINWLLLVASVPICARYIKHSYSYNPPLSILDARGYKQMLARFGSDDFTLEEFYQLIPLVMPQDLLSVLKTTKNRCFSSSYPYRALKSTAECNDVNSPPAQDLLRKRLNDWDLIFVMQGCGRDVVNILADSMENPEREFALISRAKLGDVRVKAKLEELLASRLANGEPPELNKPNKHSYGWDRPAKSIDIICALVCISEPNEAGTRFMDYVLRHDVSQLVENDKFLRGITLLPTIQAREVIKAYLAKAQDWRPAKEVIFSPMREVVGTYTDRDISEAVLKIMFHSKDNDIMEVWRKPWEIPQDFDMQSADLLRQGLASKNEQLRAWCVWQLRKVGYQFSEDEMSRLLKDESWKVRANAVIAGGPPSAGRAAKDTNPFVRWIASLTGGEVKK
jgi:hypothetical protein